MWNRLPPSKTRSRRRRGSDLDLGFLQIRNSFVQPPTFSDALRLMCGGCWCAHPRSSLLAASLINLDGAQIHRLQNYHWITLGSGRVPRGALADPLVRSRFRYVEFTILSGQPESRSSTYGAWALERGDSGRDRRLRWLLFTWAIPPSSPAAEYGGCGRPVRYVGSGVLVSGWSYKDRMDGNPDTAVSRRCWLSVTSGERRPFMALYRLYTTADGAEGRLCGRRWTASTPSRVLLRRLRTSPASVWLHHLPHAGYGARADNLTIHGF